MNIVGSPAGIHESLFGVGFAGGTLLAAGDNGEIYTSLDGSNVYLQPAGGAFATTNWRAVGIADAQHALVGGTGGALVQTGAAGTVPDTKPPTGLINGPSSVTAGVPTTYTAVVSDEAGGSGINPASLVWTSPGLPTQTGASATYSFPAAGTYSLTLSFADNAGNTATAGKVVFVSGHAAAPPPPPPPPTTKTTNVTVSGGTVTLSSPTACVAAGKTFVVTLSFKRSTRKGVNFIKVRRTDFYIGSKRVKTLTRPPFVAHLKVKAGTRSGSSVTVLARAFIKVHHGPSPTKSIHATLKVC
jgi:hypothetical protein